MTRRCIFAAILMLMSASQQPQAQPAGLAAIKASNAYINCLMRATNKFDDRHSNAADMGKTIQAACVSDEQRWENAQTANFPAWKKREFSEKIKADTAAIAVRIVEEERRLKF